MNSHSNCKKSQVPISVGPICESIITFHVRSCFPQKNMCATQPHAHTYAEALIVSYYFRLNSSIEFPLGRDSEIHWLSISDHYKKF